MSLHFIHHKISIVPRTQSSQSQMTNVTLKNGKFYLKRNNEIGYGKISSKKEKGNNF